ncbi:hypothetical protein EI28_13400 [Methanoculleus sp. MH98A]|nr:hypothetical protein EI28_13400 [Methanoculleus sp. MH98A]
MLHAILLEIFFSPLPGDADAPGLMAGPRSVAVGIRDIGLQVQSAPVPGCTVGDDPDGMRARRESDLPGLKSTEVSPVDDELCDRRFGNGVPDRPVLLDRPLHHRGGRIARGGKGPDHAGHRFSAGRRQREVQGLRRVVRGMPQSVAAVVAYQDGGDMALPETPVVASKTRSDLRVDRRGFGDGVKYPAVLGEGLDVEFVAACHAVEVDGRDDFPGKVCVAFQPVGTPPKSDLLAGEGDEVDRPVQGLRLERPCNL